jgi:hypothetical protein
MEFNMTVTSWAPNPTIAPEVVRCLSQYNMQSLSSGISYLRFILQVPLMLIITPVGLAGNCLAFIVIGREKPFTSTSILLRALAVADSMVLLAGVFFMDTMRRIHFYVIQINAYMEFYNLSYGYLKIVFWIAKSASLYLTVCVAGGRFVAVCRPLRAASICTKKNAYISIVSVYFFSFLYRCPIAFGYTAKYHYDPCVRRMRPIKTYTEIYQNPIYHFLYINVLAIVFNVLVPTSVLIVITSSVLTILRNSIKDDTLRTSVNRSEGANSATVRVMAVAVVNIILETPEAVLEMVGVINSAILPLPHYSSWRNPLYYIARFLSKVNSFINVFIYCATGRLFRRGLV